MISSRMTRVRFSTKSSTISSIFSCCCFNDIIRAFDFCNWSDNQVLSCFESLRAS